MKILKKILPILNVASIAAIVTPIVTSCGSSVVIDGTKLFVPTIAQAVADDEHKETGYNSEDATQLYFKNLKANPEIFIQDGLALASVFAHGILDKNTVKYYLKSKLKWTFDFSKIKVDDTKGRENLSFSFKESFYCENIKSSATPLTKANLLVKIEVEKLYYQAFYNENYGWWSIDQRVEPTPSKDTIITMNVSGYMNGITSSTCAIFDNEQFIIDSEHTSLPKKWETIYKFAKYCIAIDSSYHMSGIKPNIEP